MNSEIIAYLRLLLRSTKLKFSPAAYINWLKSTLAGKYQYDYQFELKNWETDIHTTLLWAFPLDRIIQDGHLWKWRPTPPKQQPPWNINYHVGRFIVCAVELSQWYVIFRWYTIRNMVSISYRRRLSALSRVSTVLIFICTWFLIDNAGQSIIFYTSTPLRYK